MPTSAMAARFACLYTDSMKIEIIGSRSTRKADSFEGPGLAVQKIEIEGPLVDQWPGRGHLLRFGDLKAEDTGPKNQRDKSYYKPQWRLTATDPQKEVGPLLKTFAAAAFRRPVDDTLVAPFIALAQAELTRGATLEQALRTAQMAILCAPDFLYLLEPAPVLDDYALAARLSYMLWGLPPDAELLQLAAQRNLGKPRCSKRKLNAC